MAHLEIDRLKVAGLGNDETSVDLQLEAGSIGCIFSRNRQELIAVADAITGFGGAYEGRIFLGGKIIEDKKLGHSGIAACGYGIGLYNHLHVADNLAIPLKATGMSDFEVVARVDAAIEDSRLSDIADLYPEDLEDDEKLRVSFTKASIASPGLLVCYLTGVRGPGFEFYPILSDIARCAHELNLTILAITDNGFSALTVADQISYMKNGSIIQQGTPRDIINSPERIEIAEDFAFPQLNTFEGLVSEESPFLFVENQDMFFNLPERLRDYFRARVGAHQAMAVRPEKVHLIHPDEVQRRGRNIVKLSRVDYFGFGIFTYFDFGDLHWCAFLPSNRVAYVGMQMGVFVPEEEWFFHDDEGKILLDL